MAEGLAELDDSLRVVVCLGKAAASSVAQGSCGLDLSYRQLQDHRRPHNLGAAAAIVSDAACVGARLARTDGTVNASAATTGAAPAVPASSTASLMMPQNPAPGAHVP